MFFSNIRVIDLRLWYIRVEQITNKFKLLINQQNALLQYKRQIYVFFLMYFLPTCHVNDKKTS